MSVFLNSFYPFTGFNMNILHVFSRTVIDYLTAYNIDTIFLVIQLLLTFLHTVYVIRLIYMDYLEKISLKDIRKKQVELKRERKTLSASLKRYIEHDIVYKRDKELLDAYISNEKIMADFDEKIKKVSETLSDLSFEYLHSYLAVRLCIHKATIARKDSQNKLVSLTKPVSPKSVSLTKPVSPTKSLSSTKSVSPMCSQDHVYSKCETRVDTSSDEEKYPLHEHT